jgi:formate/nitrite transporter FocA (FNT family)
MEESGQTLTPSDQQEAEERVSVTPRILHEAIRLQGEEELKRPVSALAFSGLAAGLTMGSSLMIQGVLAVHLPAAVWKPLVVKLGYSFGYLIVILGRQQLFTENTLTAVIPLLATKEWKTFRAMLRLWSVVLCANLAGAHIIAWVLGNTAAFRPEVQNAFAELAREAANVTPGQAVLRGIFAGWLIAMVVWLLASVETGRIAVIVILTYAVGLAGFTHIVAGSVDLLFLVMTGQESWLTYASHYMLPTLVGNTIGGVSLVSALNHAQVMSGEEPK